MTILKRLSRKPLAAAGASAALVLTMTAGTASAANPPGANARANTATVAAPINEASLGAVNPAQPLNISVALNPRNQAGLDQTLAGEYTPGSPNFHKFLTPQQYDAQFAPDQGQVNQVTSWLTSQGLTNVKPSANNMQVSATGTAGQIEQAFQTQLSNFASSKGTVFANTKNATVPAALGGVVNGVLGLNDVPATPTGLKAAGGTATALTPPQFKSAYDGANLAPASGQNIGVVSEGKLTGVVSDLRAEETQNNLPQVPVNIVQENAASGSSTDTSGTDEWDLDSQSSTGIAGAVSSLTFFNAASLSLGDLGAVINDWAGQSTVKQLSASLGLCEGLASAGGGTAAIDNSLKQAAAQGMTFFASSGDNGAACPLPIISQNGIPLLGLTGGVEYPAASQWAVGVGGTTLSTNAGPTHGSETAWQPGGGGFAFSERQAPWVGPASSNGLQGNLENVFGAVGGGRPVPDIAMDADPTSGAKIIYNGAPHTFGGTSLAAPLANGGWALIQQADGGNLGDAAPAFYRLYNGHPAGQTPGFHDVTSGNNGLYFAGTGFDETTGIGTYDLAPLAGAL